MRRNINYCIIWGGGEFYYIPERWSLGSPIFILNILFIGDKQKRVVRVYYSEFPTRNTFERISNNIPFVNSLMLFIPTLSLQSQIRNHRCAPNRQQQNLISSISTCNTNTFLYYIISSMLQAAWTFTSLTQKTQIVMRKLFTRIICNLRSYIHTSTTPQGVYVQCIFYM